MGMSDDLQAARERVRRVKELGDDGDAIRKVYRHQMERLRDEDPEAWGRSKPIDYVTPDYAMLADAYCELHDELARLRAENERLRKCLELFANKRNWVRVREGDIPWLLWQILDDPRQLAADALRGEGG